MLMAEQELEILHGYELRLLRCTLTSPSSNIHLKSQMLNDQSPSIAPLHAYINNLIDSIESGNYLQALASDAARIVIGSLEFDFTDTAECADQVYSELLHRVEAFIVNDSENDMDKACRVVLVTCLAVAALFWFIQCNMIG